VFKTKNAIRYARSTLLWIMVLTLVNLAFFFFNMDVAFPYSLFSPLVAGIRTVSYFFFEDMGNAMFNLSLFILIMGAFLTVYLLSINKPKLLALAFAMFLADTIYMVYLSLSFGGMEWLVDLFFHVWVLYTLGFGAYAAFKAPKEDPKDIVPEIFNENERV